jgi:hypothetical protein
MTTLGAPAARANLVPSGPLAIATLRHAHQRTRDDPRTGVASRRRLLEALRGLLNLLRKLQEQIAFVVNEECKRAAESDYQSQ